MSLVKLKVKAGFAKVSGRFHVPTPDCLFLVILSATLATADGFQNAILPRLFSRTLTWLSLLLIPVQRT